MTAIMGGFRTIISLLSDLATFIWLLLRPQGTLAAENLLLRKQLAMYQRRNLKPRWPNTSFCIALANVGFRLQSVEIAADKNRFR